MAETATESTCLYDILGVARDASDDQLKKAYRKLAVKWHPDKNIGNVDHATEIFKHVQHAYAVLSDRNERAWYDDHREAILRGGRSRDGTAGCGSDDEADDDYAWIFPLHSATAFRGFNDSPTGFYGVYAAAFATLADDERRFGDAAA